MKAISEVISTLLIVVLGIGLFATAYTVGFPLIQKTQDRSVLDRVDNYFDINNLNSLPRRIDQLTKVEGDATFFSDVSGLWKLFPCADVDQNGKPREGCEIPKTQSDANSIEFSFVSTVSKIITDGTWVPLSAASSCPPASGTLGADRSAVVCSQALEKVGDRVEVKYRIWFREVVDPNGDRFKINLVKHPASPPTSTANSVRISFVKRRAEIVNGKNLIVTEVQILLA